MHHQPELRERPFALTRPVANKGSKVIACCERARRRGVRPGMLVAEALAVLPTLTCVDEDLDADRQTLVGVAEWAQRYSPLVGLEDAIAPTCIFLDMTGGVACFGGDAALLEKAHAEFNADGWTVTIAIADTIGAAWAHAACGLAFAEHIASAKPQAELPLAALRLSAAAATILRRLGIERIGQLLELPRDEIALRFGPEVGLRLDQLTGLALEVITPLHPLPEAASSWAFDDPIDRHDILLRVLDVLLERLQAILEQRHAGTRLLECTLELEGALTQRFECSLARPARTARYLGPLVRLKLEQIHVEAPVRALSVRAVLIDRFADEQPNLFDAGNDAALAHLLDNLTSRLGKDAVTVPHPVADPQPELACRFVACGLAPAEQRPVQDSQSVFAHRPLRLLARPVPITPLERARAILRFHHAGVDHTVIRSRGPERIDTGWWRGPDVERDYYLVETEDGTRWWLFQRRSDGRWFLHGCFD